MAEIYVGYIEDFKFKDSLAKEQMSGHPEVGGVYQIFFLDGLYHIHIGKENTKAHLDGITIGESLSGNYMDKWEFNVVKLTKENFIDYPLSVEQMEKVGAWFSNDHADLRKLLERSMDNVAITSLDQNGAFEPVSEEEAKKLHKAIGETLEKHFPVTKNLISRISASLNQVLYFDPEKLEAIAEVLESVADATKLQRETAEGSDIAQEFLLFAKSPEPAVYDAIKYLSSYTKGEQFLLKDNVFKAIQSLLLEIQRRNLQDD